MFCSYLLYNLRGRFWLFLGGAGNLVWFPLCHCYGHVSCCSFCSWGFLCQCYYLKRQCMHMYDRHTVTTRSMPYLFISTNETLNLHWACVVCLAAIFPALEAEGSRNILLWFQQKWPRLPSRIAQLPVLFALLPSCQKHRVSPRGTRTIYELEAR